MCVCVAYAVSKPSVDISPICIILIKAGGYHLTLPAAHCCTVKNTARVFWEQQVFAMWSCALRKAPMLQQCTAVTAAGLLYLYRKIQQIVVCMWTKYNSVHRMKTE